MAAADRAVADPAPADRIVLLSLVLLLVAIDALARLRSPSMTCAWLPAAGLYAPTALIGALVGFAELVSRYRDAPWTVAMQPPGLVFIALNAAAAAAALFLMVTFPAQLHTPEHPVMKVLVAGTGAMVTIRTKIFTLRQPGGGDVAVGPAFILDTALTAVNRDVDRRRARWRMDKVARTAARIAATGSSYPQAYDFLAASLGAFQNLDVEASQRLRENLKQLKDDVSFSKVSDEVKFLMAGYSILTEFGDRAFDVVFASLQTYLKEPAQMRPA